MKRKNPRRPDKRVDKPTSAPRSLSLPEWILPFLLVIAVLLAYQPAWHAGFIWDDDGYVTNNPLLTAPDGWWRIWFSADSPSQYFPLTYTVFRLEHLCWGLHATGYHLVNILLHAINALLVWRLLKRLAVPGAGLAAAIFALHPVQVEAVAWITELKSILSLFFILLALLAWNEFIAEKPNRPWRWYTLALIYYMLALFSKTTACTLPAALLLLLWWKHRSITWQRVLQIIPFFVIGLGMGLLTVWWERYHIGTQGGLFALGSRERLLVASHALWFYPGKLIWPVDLMFTYPKWTLHPADPLAYGWLAALVGLGAVIYFFRRFAGRSVETAVLFYMATLSPVLGFIMLYTFRYTFVADHYQYVASIGLIALAAAGITLALDRFAGKNPVPRLIVYGGLVSVLGFLTWHQCGMYANLETLWRTTAAKNPGSYLAHNDLGFVLLNTGRDEEAAVQFQRALEIDPALAETHYNLGTALSDLGRTDEALAQYQKALDLGPNLAEVQNQIGLARGDHPKEAIDHFRAALQLKPDYAEAHFNLANVLVHAGQVREAIVHYEKALALAPQSLKTANNLATVLATCPDDSCRNGRRAVEVAESASRLADGENPVILATLASAYAEAGRFPDAIATARRALQSAVNDKNINLTSLLRMQLDGYQRGLPFRDSTLTNNPAGP